VPVPTSLLGEASVTGPVGSLALSCVRPLASALCLRVVRWHEGLGRLGVTLPFFLVHDVGLVLAVPGEQYERGPRAPVAHLAGAPAKLGALLVSYSALLDELGEGEVAKRAAELKMSDDLVIVVLSRLLGGVATELAGEGAIAADIPVDASIFDALEPQLTSLFSRVKRTFELRALEAIDAGKLFVLTVADALDIDTLRLFGMVGSDAAAGAIAQVDMLAALESPEANDIVNFSLELLPSVLETKARPAAGLTASHGYSGIATRGSIDSMVLTELAWDDLELARRITDNEVLYYAREQAHEEQHRVHTLLVDASASMRGERRPRSLAAWPSPRARSSCSRATRSCSASSTHASTKRTAPTRASCPRPCCSRFGASAAETRRACSPSWPPSSISPACATAAPRWCTSSRTPRSTSRARSSRRWPRTRTCRPCSSCPRRVESSTSSTSTCCERTG
jgi:hypothetical protein